MTLFASSMLLVHAVIPHPHHHHHHQVCFDKEHCLISVLPQDNNLPEQNQPHDCNKFPGCCFLSEYIVTTPNQVYRYCTSNHDQDNPSLENAVYVDSARQVMPVYQALGIPFPPDLSFLTFLIIGSSSGLRAPPLV